MVVDFGQSMGSTGMSGGSSTLGSDTLGTGSSYTYTYGDTSTGTASDARRVRISNTVSFLKLWLEQKQSLIPRLEVKSV